MAFRQIFVNDYSEITDILRTLERAVLSNNVFISGSADFYNDEWPNAKIEDLAYQLANQLIQEGFKVTLALD